MDALAVIGLLCLLWFATRLVTSAGRWLFQLTSADPLRPPSPQDYALVTGSTDGIGLEYARQLAQRGYRLLLLSRSEQKLAMVASEIRAQHPQCQKVFLVTLS